MEVLVTMKEVTAETTGGNIGRPLASVGAVILEANGDGCSPLASKITAPTEARGRPILPPVVSAVTSFMVNPKEVPGLESMTVGGEQLTRDVIETWAPVLTLRTFISLMAPAKSPSRRSDGAMQRVRPLCNVTKKSYSPKKSLAWSR
jgi:hypothetical protein